MELKKLFGEDFILGKKQPGRAGPGKGNVSHLHQSGDIHFHSVIVGEGLAHIENQIGTTLFQFLEQARDPVRNAQEKGIVTFTFQHFFNLKRDGIDWFLGGLMVKNSNAKARYERRHSSQGQSRKTAQQPGEMIFLPSDRLLEAGILFFSFFELRRVVRAAASPFGPRTGYVLMEHFVKDDELNEVERNLGTVKQGVNPNRPQMRIVNAQPNRAPFLLGGHLAPSNRGVDRPIEKAGVDPIKNFLEVKVFTLAARRHSDSRLGVPNRSAVGADVVVDLPTRLLRAFGNII